MSFSQQPIKTGTDFDCLVIGAGFSGMYMLHLLREAGFSTRVIEKGDGVGGAWYWSRYPGARCDSESVYYNYTFSEELYNEWTWSSRFPEQPEILRYLNFAADRLDLRRDIQFNTEVRAAHFDEDENIWRLHLSDGTSVTATYFISGVGCLSINATNIPNFKGLEQFEGDWYHTGAWPHHKVNFRGKRVGVIGTGSSGVQTIPVIAQEAEHLTVFQRTPQYSVPANNHPLEEEFIQYVKNHLPEIRGKMRESLGGLPFAPFERSALDDTPEERRKVYEEAWEKGGSALFFTYPDLLTNEESNTTASEFIRSKIKEIVKDPETAEKLMPTYYYGTKRAIMDTNYFETYNRDNVSLVDVKKAPIAEITAKGVRTEDREYELDVLVFATGYDGMTGPLLKMDIRGRDGETLKQKWENGAHVRTYLGLTTAGFPNMFMITGPESPSVLGNVPVAIEQHVEWTADCLKHMRETGMDTIEATQEAEEEWSRKCREMAEATLYTKTESWYTGANIEGKPRGFLMYLGGYGPYRELCDEIAEKGYEGFALASGSNTVV
ncbi:flavin-containing monooxygenase [Bacillus benzoevorans]|uniref:Cation diffusion facilitator CzcD-associated flavoprotein CzcO n=1 Tax=Bacillus benzoevorans TaxID=1456 RepID=A0A7X0HTQ3_9BACI|nr:NAD(P)/FAD-dependent oxidoreductase [Bacillus benzoevorans]MBB6446685.1 cation diffusion facilitator CzcD-associated flavoprotein CzcO [Bacillus benzoevorans]